MPRLRYDLVPEGLRDLIPLAERWGEPADTRRHRLMEAASDEQLEELSSKLSGRHRLIEEWLYSFRTGEPVSPEAIAFQSLVVAELEECDGPGLRGYLDYALAAWREDPSPASAERLRDAYSYTKGAARGTGSLFLRELREAEAILFPDSAT